MDIRKGKQLAVNCACNACGHWRKLKRNGLTCNFVPDELAGLDLPDGRKKRPDLFLSHGLGQIVDY